MSSLKPAQPDSQIDWNSSNINLWEWPKKDGICFHVIWAILYPDGQVLLIFKEADPSTTTYAFIFGPHLTLTVSPARHEENGIQGQAGGRKMEPRSICLSPSVWFGFVNSMDPYSAAYYIKNILTLRFRTRV